MLERSELNIGLDNTGVVSNLSNFLGTVGAKASLKLTGDVDKRIWF